MSNVVNRNPGNQAYTAASSCSTTFSLWRPVYPLKMSSTRKFKVPLRNYELAAALLIIANCSFMFSKWFFLDVHFILSKYSRKYSTKYLLSFNVLIVITPYFLKLPNYVVAISFVVHWIFWHMAMELFL